ncbi:MAG: patatin-like phospholipase family protein [Candidatus Marinimicrobia bacterium]|nr:patatin-like phospholipase family protein [Candidatus Neomarinimicrobiota bacterium]
MPTKMLGLALSGGGFRASFFHIGVLAQMARLGILRKVDVISTVSGGSIIGAQYFLYVKKLLETKSIKDINDEDYRNIVYKIEKIFLKAVQKNFRMRTFLNFWKNLKMFMPNYSRSDRIAELYDKELYRNYRNKHRDTRIRMDEIKIKPIDGKPSGDPETKVPVILINATTLNSGHNWRFGVETMGEPYITGGLYKQIDKNLELRRPQSYKVIKSKRRDIGLGIAVSASASVPALFPPLSISNLYEDDIRVELVDGGVHDNQGIQGLIDNDCTEFVISDASGQMKDEFEPATGMISVLLRSSSIFQDRVREEELNGLMKGKGPDWPCAFMHLRKNLKARVEWPIVTEEPSTEESNENVEAKPEDFGVDHDVQELLSKIRTDLDSFTEVEAYSLMLDAYLMSKPEIKRAFKIEKDEDRLSKIDKKYEWKFLKIKPWIAEPTKPYLKQLDVAHQMLFKVFRLSWLLTTSIFLTVAAIVYYFWPQLTESFMALMDKTITYRTIAILVGALLIGFIPKLSRAFKVLRIIRAPSEYYVRLVGRTLLSIIGSLFIAIHLLVFDRLFLWLGKVNRLKEPKISEESGSR